MSEHSCVKFNLTIVNLPPKIPRENRWDKGLCIETVITTNNIDLERYIQTIKDYEYRDIKAHVL